MLIFYKFNRLTYCYLKITHTCDRNFADCMCEDKIEDIFSEEKYHTEHCSIKFLVTVSNLVFVVVS